MKNIFLILLISFLFFTKSYAQLEGLYTKVNQVTPPPPTSAALGSYGNYPISDFRGVPNINIPLIEMSLKNTKLPISLSYDASGIKVEQISYYKNGKC